MRFWRRGMPEDGAPDPDAIPPEAAEVAMAERVAAVVAPELPSEAPSEAADARGWFGRLRTGLSRSSTQLTQGINTIFLRRRLRGRDFRCFRGDDVGVRGAVLRHAAPPEPHDAGTPTRLGPLVAVNRIRCTDPVASAASNRTAA